MPLKTDYANGDQLTATAFNEVTTAVNASYTKPGTGIPSTDLAAAVQTSLGKADSAVQSVSSTSITDATTTGKALLTTTDASTARTTLGVAYGTTAGTVAQGNDSRFSPSSTSISDSTATGRALITTTDASTARTTLGVAYGTTAGTVAQGNDSRITGAVASGGALGTPSSGTLTNCTGLPVAGITGTLTVGSGGSGATTLSGVLKGNGTSAFTAATAGTDYVAPSGALGTPSSGTLTNCTSLPVSGITASTSAALGVGTVELGHATDTTLSRSAAGVLAVEGVDVVTTSATQTLTNKTATNPTITNYVESVVAIGTVTSTNTIALTSGTVQTATLTASTACTFTMPTATAGKSFVLLLKQAATTGNGTATFTGVKWSGGTAPTITATAARMDVLSFIADGTNWYGSFVQNFTP
jgi:hypothetical protein